MLGADLVGLHLPRYVRAFADALRDIGRELEWSRSPSAGGLYVETAGHRTRVVAAPIGIDVNAWRAMASDPYVCSDAATLRRALGTKRVLLAVDRMDYSKGVVERLEAYERALERAPGLRKTVTLVQIGVPTRESLDTYRQLRMWIEATIGRIQGRFGTPDWSPARFFATCLSPRELAPYYVAADAALVTPLRDGMNLVAFEYACCAPPGGRLLLSVLAGAADILREAYHVNPYDEDKLTEALIRMASPGSEVDELRMSKLRARVASMPVEAWVERFLSDLGPSHLALLSAGSQR
jgi:trehalose 6-phosphate synthase